MTAENGARLLAGTIVIATTAMSHPQCPLYVSSHLLFVAGLVGLTMVQTAFTGFCPAAFFLKKLGMKSGERSAISPSP